MQYERQGSTFHSADDCQFMLHPGRYDDRRAASTAGKFVGFCLHAFLAGKREDRFRAWVMMYAGFRAR